MPLLDCTGGVRRKGWSKLHLPREGWTLPGSPSGMHDASDMLSLALLLFPQSNEQQFPRRRDEQQVTQLSPEEVSTWNPSILLPANPYRIDWYEEAMVFLSPLWMQRLTEAAGHLGAFLLHSHSSGWRGTAGCWGWAFGGPSFPPHPIFFSFFLKWGVAKLQARFPKCLSQGEPWHADRRNHHVTSEHTSHDFVLVPKDSWASTFVVQQISRGSWQHLLILSDVTLIFSNQGGADVRGCTTSR